MFCLLSFGSLENVLSFTKAADLSSIIARTVRKFLSIRSPFFNSSISSTTADLLTSVMNLLANIRALIAYSVSMPLFLRLTQLPPRSLFSSRRTFPRPFIPIETLEDLISSILIISFCTWFHLKPLIFSKTDCSLDG